MKAAEEDAMAQKMTWYDFSALWHRLHSAEAGSLDKVRRLERTAKRLEKRLDRLKKTAARIPKDCRGDEIKYPESLGRAGFC